METENTFLKRSFSTMKQDDMLYELAPKKKIKPLDLCGSDPLKECIHDKDDAFRKYIYLKKLLQKKNALIHQIEQEGKKTITQE